MIIIALIWNYLFEILRTYFHYDIPASLPNVLSDVQIQLCLCREVILPLHPRTDKPAFRFLSWTQHLKKEMKQDKRSITKTHSNYCFIHLWKFIYSTVLYIRSVSPWYTALFLIWKWYWNSHVLLINYLDKEDLSNGAFS